MHFVDPFYVERSFYFKKLFNWILISSLFLGLMPLEAVSSRPLPTENQRFEAQALYAAQESSLHEKPSDTPDKIEVKPITSDEKISQRVESILKTTNWFIDPQVRVENGVVFLSGQTKSHQFKDWAGNLALNTQGVAAVVNKIEVLEPSIWSLHLILQEFVLQGQKLIRTLPIFMFALIILALAFFLARLIYRLIPLFFRGKRVNPSLLHEVIARAISIFIFLLGIYFIFEMAELTRMAITVISGTGLVGIIIGIAFRDITENFLASVLLSMQNPFEVGDFIDILSPVSGYAATGYVERLTFRVTILITADGKHLQIPNSTVYKSNICNHTSSPNRRDDFKITLNLQTSISKVQDIILKVLNTHEAVLKNPEPLVLVEELTQDMTILHIYYWIDGSKYNWSKVKSALIRLVKKSFQTEHIEPGRFWEKELEHHSSKAESKLSSQASEMKKISKKPALPEKRDDLLKKNPDPK